MRRLAAFLLIGVANMACEKPAPAPKANEPAAPAKQEGSAAPSAQVTAKLAQMDAFDGASDKVVGKCPACMMKMDGSKDHAFAYSGYTMHFCTAHCKETWEKDPSKSVLALKMP